MKFEEFEFVNYDYQMNDIYAYDFKNLRCVTSDEIINPCYHTNKQSAINSLWRILILK